MIGVKHLKNKPMTHNINTLKMYLGTGVEFYPAENSDLYYDIYADYPTWMLYSEALEIKEPQAIELSKSTIKQKEDFIAYEDGELFLGQCVNSLGFDMDDVFLSEVRLCLHPMSKLTEEIEHDGKTFVPIEWLEDKYPTLDLHRQCERIMEDARWVNQCDYMLITHLIKWHFALDLHPSLWVEKQTVKKRCESNYGHCTRALNIAKEFYLNSKNLTVEDIK